MFIFADNEPECLGNIAGLAIFLLLTFGGWIISLLSKAGKQKNLPRHHRQAAAPPKSPEQSTREMAAFLDQARQPQGQQPSVQLLESSPYAAGQRDPYVMEAEVVEDAALASHTLTSSLAADTTQTEQDVHERFDYEVGVLGDSSDAVHEDPSKDQLPKEAVTTGEIVDIFRSPERIREAIILNEILKPPDF